MVTGTNAIIKDDQPRHLQIYEQKPYAKNQSTKQVFYSQKVV